MKFLALLQRFYRATLYALGLSYEHLSVRPSVRLSVRLSAKRVNCDKTKEISADILIPHEI